MANKKISELTSLTGASIADGDQIEIRDITAATADQNKKTTISDLKTVFGAAATIADNALVRGDGGGNNIQGSGITVDDSNNTSGMGTLGCGAVTSSGLLTGTALNLGDEDMDEYDEGTWTPAAVGYSGSLSIASGWYTRIGREVFLYAIFQGDGTVDASQVVLSGLPFASTNIDANWETNNFTGRESSAGVVFIHASLTNNSSQIAFRLASSGAIWTYTAMAAGFNTIAGHYFTDA